MQLATCQCRLQHIAGIHRAFGLARANHGVQFIDKDDGLACILFEFFQHRFQALLEFATVLGTGKQ